MYVEIMVEDVVNIHSINAFVVKYEVKKFARFLKFTLLNGGGPKSP
jgi:hypothetical protein